MSRRSPEPSKQRKGTSGEALQSFLAEAGIPPDAIPAIFAAADAKDLCSLALANRQADLDYRNKCDERNHEVLLREKRNELVVICAFSVLLLLVILMALIFVDQGSRGRLATYIGTTAVGSLGSGIAGFYYGRTRRR